jgi:two-component system, NarL family, response regulator DesR
LISVLIAEDVHMLRRALVSLLSLESDIDVVAEVASGRDIIPRALALKPDVAVLDIDLPDVDGITAAGELRERLPECRTIFLTSLGRPGNLQRAMAVKASGFLLKDLDPEALVDAIRRVARGERIIDPQLALATLDAGPSPLTPREIQILARAADGEEPAEIARHLCLAPGTVRNYLSNIVLKLQSRNRVDAIRIAREAGWL